MPSGGWEVIHAIPMWVSFFKAALFWPCWTFLKCSSISTGAGHARSTTWLSVGALCHMITVNLETEVNHMGNQWSNHSCLYKGAPIKALRAVWRRLPGWHHSGCIFVVVQLWSCAQLFAIPWTAAYQASLLFTISRSLLKLMSIESVMPSNHLIFCHPLLLLPSIFPCMRVFSNDSALHIKWPEYWSFSSSISPSNEYLGLMFFRIEWFDLLVFPGTFKSLLQHHNLKTSILWR